MSETTIFLKNRLERLQRGDLRARDELIAKVSHRLTILAERMLRDYPRVARWEQADDICQQAAIRLHRCLAEIVPPTPEDFLRLAALQLRRELKDLARHYFGPEGQGANHASTAPKSGKSTLEPLNHEQGDTTCNPEKLAIWTEFHAAVETLPEIEQKVFDLLWYHELPQAEAAEILQVSERQVRRYWQSARLSLQRKIGSFSQFHQQSGVDES